ncbi:PKD domain-containing protein [Haloglomus salinum]|jgi:hypothetical protein|uniref:PKD domain-containing protein n=1 Tax=Haloglomus salinum TaxID=2962673 RepID=UPI0020C9D75A|nr:PKD domain-containing protein [Haloglomus salinum]
MRDYRLLLVAALVLTAGCTGGSITGGDATISDRVDGDCDDRHSELDLRLSLSYTDHADLFSETDAVVLVEYTDGGQWSRATRIGDAPSGGIERTISLTGSDFGGVEGPVRLRVSVLDDDLINNQDLGSVPVGEVAVEPQRKDRGTLSAGFDWRGDLRRNTSVTFVAGDRSDSDCPVVSYDWDFDADGTAEREGRTVTYRFQSDGYHTVTLTVADSRGREASVEREVLVVFDPDGDGVTSAIERARGSDPRDPDTDDDLFHDGIDPAPTSLLVPTGLIQGVLFALLFGAFLYSTRDSLPP